MSESRELAHAGEQGGAIQHRSESAEIIGAILQAAKDPAIDAGKVETMANLAMKMQDRELEAQFNRDLNAALSEMPVITKAGIIIIPANASKGTPERTQGRFARFEDIDRVVRPILQRHNLAIRFEVGENQQTVTVRPILSHANGHTERGEAMRLPLDTSGAKNNVQGAGSAVTYGKRYTMCALLNIITEGTDDDGSLGRHAIDMPHERTVTVLEQAEEAAEQGRYQEWYDGQGVKDRAWLVSSGNHARLGGEQPLIGGPEPRQQRADPPTQAGGDQGGGQGRQKRTPKQLVDAYAARVRAVKSLDELRDLQLEEGTAKWLAGMRDKHPQLHERILQINQDRLAELSPPEDEGGEPAASGQGGSDLFQGGAE
jgi:hypothetical protein